MIGSICSTFRDVELFRFSEDDPEEMADAEDIGSGKGKARSRDAL
jgi:hypothetical protein